MVPKIVFQQQEVQEIRKEMGLGCKYKNLILVLKVYISHVIVLYSCNIITQSPFYVTCGTRLALACVSLSCDGWWTLVCLTCGSCCVIKRADFHFNFVFVFFF